jgi:hypothetical protein
MLILAAAALASTSAPDLRSRRPVLPVVQATATVRIVSGATLHLGQHSDVDGQRLRMTRVSTPQGLQPASLVEFE